MEVVTTIIAVTWLLKKTTQNKDPDKNEEQEAKDMKGSAKHQGWQTLDLTEPWSGHIPGLSKGGKEP